MSSEVSLREAVKTSFLFTLSAVVSFLIVFVLIEFQIIDIDIDTIPVTYVPLILGAIFSLTLSYSIIDQKF